MREQLSLGLTTDTGSIVCQRCGLYFSPERAEQKVCGSCKKTKRKSKGYQIEGKTTLQITNTDRAVGYALGLILAIFVLIGIGNLWA